MKIQPFPQDNKPTSVREMTRVSENVMTLTTCKDLENSWIR